MKDETNTTQMMKSNPYFSQIIYLSPFTAKRKRGKRGKAQTTRDKQTHTLPLDRRCKRCIFMLIWSSFSLFSFSHRREMVGDVVM
jgi:hypothetical protein